MQLIGHNYTQIYLAPFFAPYLIVTSNKLSISIYAMTC